jgi:hypothetical protein
MAESLNAVIDKKRNRMKNAQVALIIGVFCLVLGFGCDNRKEASQIPSDYPPSLAAAAGASRVSYDRNRGADQVHYTLKAAYPAEGFVEALNSRLSREGWTPLKADFMNSDVPTAHVTGWKTMMDHRVQPAAKVHLWNGEWQNQAGDILVYVLTYRYPESGPANLSDMDVMGLHIPPEAAKKAQAHVDKF